jgi:hypothetical protein
MMLDREWLKTFAPFGIIQPSGQWLPTGACVFVDYGGVAWCITAGHIFGRAVDTPVGCLVPIDGQLTVVALSDVYQKMSGIGWILEPASDLAVGPMPMQPGMDIHSIGFDRCLQLQDVHPSMPCVIAGQTYGLPGIDAVKPTPILLDGIIAGIDLPTQRVFLSVPMFPGNNGGPIIAYLAPLQAGDSTQLGVSAAFLAGIVTETLVIPRQHTDVIAQTPMHLGSGASIDAVKNLLFGAEATRMLSLIKSLPSSVAI